MKLLTVEDLAKRYRCSTSRINQLPKEKLPPRFELPGSRTRFWREDVVEAWENSLPGGAFETAAAPPALTQDEVSPPSAAPRKRGAPRKPVLTDRRSQG